MKYDFIEIGTANFDTLIENATDETIGISIEPISYYLNQLPNKKNVKKLNLAISTDNEEKEAKIYYVPEQFIYQFRLPSWLSGCNSVNDYHPQHRKLQVEHLVVKEKIKCVPLQKIFEDFDVTELDLLKIDTEGSDCDILLSFSNKNILPKKIIFEANILTSPIKIELVLEKFKNLGYKLISDIGDATVLVLE